MALLIDSDTLREDLSALDDTALAAFLARQEWLSVRARPKQLLPAHDGQWDTILWIAGRGFGKTLTLVEAGWWEAYRQPCRVHAIAPTLGDVRRTLLEGPSGFLSVLPPEIVRDYNKTEKKITLTNGSEIEGFSATEEADRLRGPQCHHILFDETAAADRPAGNLESVWKVASLGCRLICPDGSPSLRLLATTPKPIPFLKLLAKRPNVRVINGSSYENFANLSKAMRDEVSQYEGTTYGRQEIYGEFVDDDDLAIFKRKWFRLWPAGMKLPEFLFIIESYDTAASEHDFDAKKQERDPTACSIWGVFNVAQCFPDPKERARLGVKSRYAALLCDVWTEYLGFPELLERARTQHRKKWGSPGRRADIVLIEDKSSGTQLRQMLTTYGVPAWPYNPGQMSKTMRAHAVSPLPFQGMVFVPESALPERKGRPRDWVEPFLQQVCAFAGPGSVKHDDILDTFTSALLYLKDRGLLEVKPDREFMDAEEKRDADQKIAQKIKDRTTPRVNPYS